ncbi:MAG: DUF4381 domain-containing protein [Pseudomonadota bacterium]
MSADLAGKDLVELLNLLEPVPEPEQISLMPQTAGWVWLAIFVGALCVLSGHWVLKSIRANAYRRTALQELSQAGNDAGRIAAIVRRTALVAYPRDEVAHLSGESWLDFLDRTMGEEGFGEGAGRQLAYGPYRSVDADPALIAAASRWIRRHRRSLR